MAKNKRGRRSVDVVQLSLFNASVSLSEPYFRCLEGIHSWHASSTSDVLVCLNPACGAMTSSMYRPVVRRVD
jgi:hypothetical protein